LKVLITGATGYIGQRLTSKARQVVYEVVAFSRRPLIQPNVVYQQYNLTDKVLPLIPSDINAVIHLAANTQQIDLDEQLELDAAKRLIEAVNSIGATFIFVSSQTAKLNAPTAYCRIKWQMPIGLLGILQKHGIWKIKNIFLKSNFNENNQRNSD